MVRSLIDATVNILFGDRLPSPKVLKVLKNKIHNVPLSKLSSILLEYNLNGRGKRNNLLKQLNITAELPESRGLWDDLVFCGSGLTPSLFQNLDVIEGDYSHKLLADTYSEEFIELFDYLWKRDKVLRQLEWGLLKIGRIYNRDVIIFDLDKERMDIIKLGNLVDIIETSNGDLVYGISKSLVYRTRGLKNYNNFKEWIRKDPIHASVILANSLDKDGKYDVKKLNARYDNRIKSHNKLKKLL